MTFMVTGVGAMVPLWECRTFMAEALVVVVVVVVVPFTCGANSKNGSSNIVRVMRGCHARYTPHLILLPG